MRAAWYDRTGPARDVLTIGEIDTPIPGPGEVRVRLSYSGINPTDAKRRNGQQGGRPAHSFNRLIPHSDGAGIIDAVGDGIPDSRIGERVWVFEGHRRRPFGTCAEYIALSADRVIPLPGSVSFEEGACIGVVAMTAQRCVAVGGDIEGRYVLVTGGAGGVGNYAIQFAKRAGATVIATVSSDRKGEDAVRAGADHVLNYRTEPDLCESILAIVGDEGLQHIVDVDFAAHLDITAKALRYNGSSAPYASVSNENPPFPFSVIKHKGIAIHPTSVSEMTEDNKHIAVAEVDKALRDGALWQRIDKVFDLGDVAAAHEYVESKACIGKALVRIG